MRTGYHVVSWIHAAEEIFGDSSTKADFSVFADTDVPQRWNGTLLYSFDMLSVRLVCWAAWRAGTA